MSLPRLILQISPLIVITYLIIRIDLFSQVLVNDYSKERKGYLSIGLILMSSALLYFFNDYQIAIYTIGIILCGRLFGFPYGSFSGIIFFILGSQITNLEEVVILLGLISDLYQLSVLDKLNIRLKDGIVAFLLGISFIITMQSQNIVLHMIAFYGSLTVITNYRLRLKSFQEQKLEIKSACQARDSLEELHSINEKLISNFNLSETCDELLRISCQQLDIKHGGLLLYDEEKDHLELKAEYNLGQEDIDKFKLPQPDCLVDALKKEETIIIDDPEVIYFGNEIFFKKEIKSVLIAPIFSKEQLKGLFIFMATKNNFFSNKDLMPLQTIIDQAPLVIRKAEIFEKLERNVAGLSMLQRTSHIITSTLDADQVFEHTVDMVMGTMGVSMAGLFLFDDDQALQLVSAKGVPKQEQESIVAEAKEVVSRVIEEEKVLINDKINEIDEKYSFNTIDIKSVIFVPLKIRGRVIGAIGAAQAGFEREFTSADKRFITILANQAAIAIENSRMYNRMEKLATKDSLTKLYNHSAFYEHLRELLKNTKENKNDLSLLMLDIDDFKRFNDTYGHQAGDKVLEKMGELLKQNVRDSDIVARYGGEEFSIALPNIDKTKVLKISNRINKAVRKEKVKYNDLELNVTVSIGVAIYQEGQSAEKLINIADKALYKAKNEGKDQTYIA
ncbi:diguanylate cyclase (GGDEF) domain-containing protein [Halobacteroides halobius DSM 5150]|uniref:Diguanylate cyclase (GGDEF) domain-containing protein n=1 Tax=Halobacteroides halobius (strain ATCC 35273 / DSM 5150 / MD-1) TaxID=748449 RepID=L0K6K5_HALHC|nr:diguanylate cyclase [Halobacteroides halobius]AGB40887.1 diguanylate cyclase (GGDEF) domain-containing protein [Halobacteroides halobius DSM 5150]